ncbi:MAG TPA: glycosyltransferase, partial [Caldilineaceae bacterium]|nr:glycosyltransferase [Caldilineaceae bacterium]
SHALFAWFPLDAYVRDPAPRACSGHAAAGGQPMTIHEAALAVAEGDRPAPAPTADLFGRQDRHGLTTVAPNRNGDGRSNGTGPHRHALIYLRGAILHDYGQTSYRIAYYLPELGFDTTLVQLGREAEERMEQGIKLVVLPMRQLPVISSLWVNLLAFRYLRAHRCDVLLCNPGLIFAARLYKRLHPTTRLVVDVRSIPVEVKGVQGWLMDRAFAAAVRARELDALSVITHGTLEMVYGRYQGRYDVPTVIWPSGVDERVFDPAISGERVRRQYGLEESFVLMYHGSLTPHRGLGLVLQALARLVAQGETRAKVVFIGKRTPHQSQLEALAAELGIGDYVLFLGPVPHEEIAEYVAAADAGLDPLPDNPWWNYSSPMKVYEYLRMGKPVLASDIHAHRNISPAVLLTRERDVEALAEAIRRLMDADEATRARLRQQALDAGACNTWRMRAATLSDFLHRYLLNTTPL